MSSLPEEIDLDILLRLPAKSLVACKFVCKSWFSLISDPDFVKSHLDIATKTNNYSLIVQSDDEINVYSITSTNAAAAVKMDFPYKPSRPKIKLLGSCNGIVYGCNFPMELVFLWNPATKEYKIIPKLESDSFHVAYHGFGYDYKTDDYKLVIMKVEGQICLVQVYSLKSNSWKYFTASILLYGFLFYQGVHCNGALHWLVEIVDESSPKIVSLNTSRERFEELQLPMTILPAYIGSMGVLDGCICLLFHVGLNFQVWVMQDYGSQESWTKLYTVTYESIMCDSRLYMDLIGSFKNGEILFRVRSNVVSYDSKYGTARKTEIDYMDRGGALQYFESLVSLNSNTVVEEGLQKKRKREKSLEI